MDAILETVKSRYLRSCLADFCEIWQDDTYWPHTVERLLKLRIFENPRWCMATILKSRYSVISSEPFDRFLMKFDKAHWPATADLTLKFRIFANPILQQPAT